MPLRVRKGKKDAKTLNKHEHERKFLSLIPYIYKILSHLPFPSTYLHHSFILIIFFLIQQSIFRKGSENRLTTNRHEMTLKYSRLYVLIITAFSFNRFYDNFHNEIGLINRFFSVLNS